MCRGKNTCSELGTDPAKWDRFSPLKIPVHLAQEIDQFVTAVDLFISGNRSACLERLKQIHSEAITHWYVEHGQMSGRHRKLILNVLPPPDMPDALRDPVRSPAKLQNEVFERDGYKCRYCGNKLIAQSFFRLLIKQLNSDLFKRGTTNLTTHGILHLAWPVADHVIPWNKGGRTQLDNLVSSCASCNYGKDGYTIEQLGIENPFKREPLTDHWKGLTDKIELLKTSLTQVRT